MKLTRWLVQKMRRRWRPVSAFAAATLIVVVSIGVTVVLRDSAGEEPAVSATAVAPTTTASTPTTTAATPTTPMAEPSTTLAVSGIKIPNAESGLTWFWMAGPSDLGTLRQLVPGCCWNVALGDGVWSGGWGESFARGFDAEAIPPSIGRFRSIVADGSLEMIAAPDVGPTTEPYVAVKEAPGSGPWTTVALPTDLLAVERDEAMLYTVWSVAFDQWGHDYAVYGTANPPGDPAGPMVGVVWTFNRPVSPAPWVASTTLVVEDVGARFFLETGHAHESDQGFVLLTSRADGSGYDAWTSQSGESWTRLGGTSADVMDVAVWGHRPLILTHEGSVHELHHDGTSTIFASADTFYLGETEPARRVRIEAGDVGIVIIGERNEVLSSSGESVSTAQVLWFSPDGAAWHHQELSDIMGGTGAVDLLVTRHTGHQQTRPTVIVALGTDQANGGPITDPQWWAARPSNY